MLSPCYVRTSKPQYMGYGDTDKLKFASLHLKSRSSRCTIQSEEYRTALLKAPRLWLIRTAVKWVLKYPGLPNCTSSQLARLIPTIGAACGRDKERRNFKCWLV